jgi:hypothetical protein
MVPRANANLPLCRDAAHFGGETFERFGTRIEVAG